MDYWMHTQILNSFISYGALFFPGPFGPPFLALNPPFLLGVLWGIGQVLAMWPGCPQLKHVPMNCVGWRDLCAIGNCSVFMGLGCKKDACGMGKAPIMLPIAINGGGISTGARTDAAWFFMLSRIILSANFLFFFEMPQLVPHFSLICCSAQSCGWLPMFWSKKFRKFKRSNQCSTISGSRPLLWAILYRFATASLISIRLVNVPASIRCCRLIEHSK